jgi:hypothetical protein
MEGQRMKTAALALLAGLVAMPAAAVPTTMTYAGVLKDNGVPVSGTVNAHFALFRDPTGGTEIYSEDDSGLIVLGGDLIAELGSNALDDSILDEPELWLEVTLDGEVMTPRVRLNSVPYALRAEAALRAEEALTLGGLTSLDVVTQTQLQAAINNATTSLSITPGEGLTKSGNTLSITTGGVTTALLAANAVDSTKILDGSVATADLANLSVTAAKIANDTITAAQIASNGVGSAEIANASVTAAKIANDTITAAQIASGGVGTAEIASGAVGSGQIATGAVTSTKLANSKHLFQVVEPGCVETVGLLTTASTCTRDTAGCSVGQCRDCNTNVCGTSNCARTFCFNDEIGFIVGP